VLVATTIAVLLTGVLLLVAGHKSGTLLEIHKVSFIVWGVVFAVHFLAYVPRVVRSLRVDWGAARREAVPGAGLRGTLLATAIGGGAALALSVLPAMNAARLGLRHSRRVCRIGLGDRLSGWSRSLRSGLGEVSLEAPEVVEILARP
jgi:hypothetical protein